MAYLCLRGICQVEAPCSASSFYCHERQYIYRAERMPCLALLGFCQLFSRQLGRWIEKTDTAIFFIHCVQKKLILQQNKHMTSE